MTDTAQTHHLAARLAKALDELPNAYEQLFWYWLPGGRPADTGSLQRHSALDTRALIMLDVLDLTDMRIKPDSDPTRQDYESDRAPRRWLDGQDREVVEDGRRRQGVVPTLRQWVARADAELWDAGQEHPEPSETLAIVGECAWLNHQLDWITTQAWLEDISDDVNRMLRDVHGIVGVEKKPRLFCTHCAWPIHEITDRVNKGGYRCSGCERVWTRLELHRMAERKRPKTLAEIATLTNISLKTLRSYADRGHLKVVARQGNASLYDLDAVALATMNLKYKPTGVRVA